MDFFEGGGAKEVESVGIGLSPKAHPVVCLWSTAACYYRRGSVIGGAASKQIEMCEIRSTSVCWLVLMLMQWTRWLSRYRPIASLSLSLSL